MDSHTSTEGVPLSETNNRSHATPSAQYCQMTVEETCSKLQTNPETGLTSSQEAMHRRDIHGSNEFAQEEEDSLIKKFFEQFSENPLLLLLIGAAAVSFFMGNHDDAISITLAILIVTTVGFVQEYRSEKSLEALNKLVPPEAHLIRAGNSQTVLASTLVPGDLVEFSVGDRIPADCRIVKAVHLSIDESNLTGETTPVTKDTNPVTGTPPIGLADRTNTAYMGTLVRDGNGTGIVVGTGSHTAFGAVYDMVSEISTPKTPLQASMDNLGKDLSLVSFGVIGVICLIGMFQGRDWLEMFTIGVSLAVAAIPEGLPIIVTVTLALGVLRMSRQKAIVRKLPSVETLGSVNVICSDKTGTLTRNHMSCTTCWTVDMGDLANAVTLKPGQSHTEADPKAVAALKNSVSLANMLKVGNLCNNSKFNREAGHLVGNATDIALIEVLDYFGLEDTRETRKRVAEVPFSSSRKWMLTSTTTGDSSTPMISVKGAGEVIAPFCEYYCKKDGKTAPFNDDMRKKVTEIASEMSNDGLRIIAFAYKQGKYEEGSEEAPEGLVFAGLMGLYDPPRPDVPRAIRRLTTGGVRVVMITGDSAATALSIGRRIGMPLMPGTQSVVEGSKLATMSDQALDECLQTASIFARTSPEDKMKIVKGFQRRGDVVAMTGDGVNDAPALKLADIGIAMGQGGTDVAKEAADMILTDDDFATILSAIEEGKGIFNNIRNFITFQLSTSMAALSIVAVATIMGLENPLNPMQILWINILMDGPPAQSLGVEPVDPDVMNKPPRPRNEKVMTPDLVKKCVEAAVIILVGTMLVYVTQMQDGVIDKRDTTMTFTCFVFYDMFNALACRSATKSVFEIGFFSNKMFLYACGASIIGQLAVVYVPFLQSVFQTEALSVKDLLSLVLISSSVWILDEAKKYFLKSRSTNNYTNSVV
ncbi:calcium-transporting ATPase 1 [Yarrowia lipolytica]|jgi:Ca2+-transporting ATPase|uniref:Calcium-transporting ATPase 1 n=2 Tax=Yarrowia lipolytica TaxID=4952 RepID=ATC1_YARLI|nr:YALI0E09471p [Yarrowia lipolytica CLIB122]O43108.1 RecName: Full=Calcium-transporting ATPase 1; AltName: Full=P-type calcium ATPase [Yarrowia lipolytica CLIB122]AAC03419.1 P-type calcium ATPase [Yarrowia lipolytica]AOW05176.1 hypothetical protein YALI1_E11674g [Yarrowia lipolytica]KAB8282020.1 calcium-transporting ATPase 1 [Yarrowia lipolytica]KAE8173423.1 calcium-transporting ATPase 1 [Yarrowia lipolytica]KAJ8056719.1 calcium-transporting ATPase 1 [Yarrowia lipolytica]|eukprot:XP_503736.1 YALI0E09471p [Yarrowia lipolytica CLIB122]